MPKTTYDTEDWHLGLFMDWTPKSRTVKCTTCDGSGKIGGGFKWIGEQEVCPDCNGTGYVVKGPDTPKPELPLDLREHMRRAWWDFHNKE